MFRTQYDRKDLVVLTNPGDPIHVTYAARYDDDGVIQLVESGKENIYDMIQSHADSVDLNLIIRRYEHGDTTALDALNVCHGSFIDVSGMPRNYAELLNLIEDGKAFFASLPLEERAKYDHDFAKWLVAASVPVDDPVVPAPVSDSVKEVTVDES